MATTAMDVKSIKKDRLRYTKNKLSSSLALLGIVFNVLYFVSIYQSDVNNYYYTMTIGFSVVCNLFFLLAAFLSSEGVKSYKMGYGYLLLVLGVLQLVRIMGIPTMAHETLTMVGGKEITVMSDKQFMYVVFCLVLSSVCCFAAGITAIIKTHTLESYKKQIQAA